MNNYNLQIGISMSVFVSLAEFTTSLVPKFTLDATAYKVMLMLLVHPTLNLQTYKMLQVIFNPDRSYCVNSKYVKSLSTVHKLKYLPTTTLLRKLYTFPLLTYYLKKRT